MAKGDLSGAAVNAGDTAVSQSSHEGSALAHQGGALLADSSVGQFRSMAVADSLPAVRFSDAVVASGPAIVSGGNEVTLDRNKKVSELIQAGVMRRIESQAGANPSEIIKPGEKPEVLITYSDTADQSKTPDFIVRKDGRIEAQGDLDAAARKQIVIQVEREPGQMSDPAQAQQKSIDELVQYVNARVGQNPQMAGRGLEINDEYGLMSQDLTRKIAGGGLEQSDAAAANSARSGYSAESQRMMSGMNRFSPGSSGSMTAREMGDYFPRRDVGQQKDETNPVVHAKNAIAGMFNPDRANPYETVRKTQSEGLAVGRYGLTYRNFMSWFSFEGEEEFSVDNIAGIMSKLAKKGKVSKEFAAKFQDKAFAAKFVGAMKRMQEGKQLSGEEMRTLFPKELQERVATDVVDKTLKDAGGDVGKAALALHLGKEPAQLTGEDLNNKANKDYMQGAVKLAQLSELRRDLGQGDKIDWQVSPEGNLMKAQIVKAGLAVARNMNTEGRCAEGVQVALSKVGMGEFLGSGDGWAMRHAFLKSDEWRVTNDPTKATAFVRSWSQGVIAENGGKNYGHVGLLHVENGRLVETSDHKTEHQINNPRYGKTIYFEYVGKQPKTLQA